MYGRIASTSIDQPVPVTTPMSLIPQRPPRLLVVEDSPLDRSLYAQMLVGMVALTGQSWLDTRKPKRDEVAAHLVNLAWNGLANLEAKPTLMAARAPQGRAPQKDAS